MNIRFSPDAARRELTPVDNLFFLEYMPDADGTFVKVYLFGLMQCCHPSLADTDMENALGLTETQIRCAFVYWQAKGLVRITGDDPLSVEYLLAEQPAVTTATPKKYRRFIESVNALLSPRSLDMRGMKAMYDCIELYGLDEGAVLALVGYCIELKGKRVSTNYMLTVAQEWSEHDIKTQNAAETYVADWRTKQHGAAEVLRRWNKRRPPTVDEMDLYDRWVNELGFDAEAILAASARMTDVASPTFAILNDRLNELKAKNVTDVQEMDLAEERNAQDREFARLVFARLGKIGAPDKTTVAQLRMFRDEKGIARDAILLAADECAGAERPMGLLKKILSDWANEHIETVEQAEAALNRPKPDAPKKPKKKKNPALVYEQTRISETDFNNLVVDLSEDL
ncbi:MAG: DnaD domain protein [Clostridia bacterium]|nr:DnaD domain protein [Clostridia bacterium]